MAFFNKEKGKQPSLDKLYKILEGLGDEDKKKIKEKFFDAERDEVKSHTNEEIAKDDKEEGRTDEAKKEEEKADEEKSESESEESEVEFAADDESVEGGEVTDAGDAEQETEDAGDDNAIEKIMETLTALEARIAQLEHANEEHDGDEFGVDSDLSDELLPSMPQSYMDAAKKMRY